MELYKKLKTFAKQYIDFNDYITYEKKKISLGFQKMEDITF